MTSAWHIYKATASPTVTLHCSEWPGRYKTQSKRYLLWHLFVNWWSCDNTGLRPT